MSALPPPSALRSGPVLLCAAPPLLHPRGPAACAAAATANALFTCPLLSVLSIPCIFPSSAHTHTNTTTTTTSSTPPHPHPTRQNTEGVAAVHVAPTPFIRQQIQAVLSDIGADCVKTGMLPTPEASVPLPPPRPCLVAALAQSASVQGCMKRPALHEGSRLAAAAALLCTGRFASCCDGPAASELQRQTRQPACWPARLLACLRRS